MSNSAVNTKIDITVITVCFNSSKTIGRTLQSVFDSAVNFEGCVELVIVDGKSSDNTIEIVNSFIWKTPDNLIVKLISEPDKGIYDAMNKGILLSSGNIVGFLNSDDMFLCSTIKTIVETFDKFDSVSAIHADVLWEYVLDDSTILLRRDGSPNLTTITTGMTINHPTLYCRRSLYASLGLFDDNLRYVADWKWAIGLFKTDTDVKYLNLPLVVFNMTGVSNQLIARRIWEIFGVYYYLFNVGSISFIRFFILCLNTSFRTLFSAIYLNFLPVSIRKRVTRFRKLKHSVDLNDFRGTF
ncbi:glycosyltransferase family 2 protein [Shewanella baltica]|uniref:glycosyltransferase family 2 protein n=1 Tax=Shewanella baltica TaxID=62322 RepID=UPI003D042103